MIRKLGSVSSAAVLALALVFQVGCPGTSGGGGGGDTGGGDTGGGDTGGGDTGGGDTGGGDTDGGDTGGGDGVFAFNLTDIQIHSQGRIRVGDDFIAFTDVDPDLTPGNVNYFMPGDIKARGIPGADAFDNNSFEVSGTKIVMTDTNFAITIFDIASGDMETLSSDDIRLVNIPVGNYEPGFYQVDGDFVVTRNDANAVADGNIVKVIDMSGDAAVVLSLPNPDGVTSGFVVAQVAVDDESMIALAVANDTFFVYDLNNPGAAPTAFDLSGADGIGDGQVAFDNGIVLFADDGSDDLVFYLDVTDAANTPVAIDTPRRGADRFVLRGNNFGFLYSGPASQGDTAAIGVMPGTGTNISDGATVFSNSTNGGRFGYGETLAYGSGGWFLGGQDNIAAAADPFQRSTDGAAWSVTADPRDLDSNLQLGDMTTNALGNLLAFKHEVDDDQFVGWVDLN